MKQPNSPAWAASSPQPPSRRVQWYDVPGFGLCPKCGKYATVKATQGNADLKIQYRGCECGHRFKTTVPR